MTEFSDGFNRVDNPTSLGSPWGATLTGTFSVLAGKARVATAAGSSVYSLNTVETGSSDGVLEATLSTVQSDTFNGLTFRGAATDAGFMALSADLWRRPSGGADVFLGTYSTPIGSGERMRASFVGSTIKIFRQVVALGAWSEVLSVTDSTFLTNTKHGLAAWGSNATAARWDDVSFEVGLGMPDVKVEIAWNAGYSTPAASRTWTDVSQWVELDRGISIDHGRSDEFGVAEANRLTLTLDNSDGRFTAEKTSGAYYPNVKIGRPIRVTSTLNGTPYVRFLGYVDEWPVAWNGGTSYASAPIVAYSRMARLGLDSELRSTITEEYLSDAGTLPSYYWPLQEAQGATAAADLMGGPSLVVKGWGLLPEFGTNMVLPGDPDGTGVLFQETGSQGLRATLTTPLSTAYPNEYSIECFAAGGTNRLYVSIEDIRGWQYAYLWLISSDDTYGASYFDGVMTSTTALATADHSEPHHLAATLALGATGTAALELWIDGVLAATSSTAGMVATSLGAVMLDADYPVGDYQTVSHVAVNADMSRIADRAEAGLSGFTDETASQRIVRYAGYANIPAGEIAGDSGTHTVGTIDTAGSGVIDAMRQVEATESGVLFDARDNTLTFHGRARRYHTTSVFTLDAAKQEVESDVAPKLDRATLVNDVTASTNDGSSARAIDQASIDEYGVARQSLDIAGNQDAGYQAARWRVLNYAQPLPRINSLGVELLPLSTSKAVSVLTADVSTRLTVAGLPAQASASSIDFFAEGYNETIGKESYEFVFNVSPVNDELGNVWIVQDATYGVYSANPLAY